MNKQKSSLYVIILSIICWSIIFPAKITYGSGAISRVNSSEKTVYLTFDDGPDEYNTLNVMEILLKYNVGGTFFFTGQNMKNYPSVVKQVYDNGFTIGLHGYDHSSLAKHSTAGIKNQLDNANGVLESITGQRTSIIRPPYGELNKSAISTINTMGYKIYTWNIDPKDWSSSTTEQQVLSNVKANLSPGAIILLHSSTGQSRAARMLPQIIEYIKGQGYQIKDLPGSESMTVAAKYSSNFIKKKDGAQVSADMFIINDLNYINVRELAKIVKDTNKQFNVFWNGANKTVEIITDEPYIKNGVKQPVDTTIKQAELSKTAIVINGGIANIPAYTINGSNYYNLRELAAALGITVTFDSANNCIVIE